VPAPRPLLEQISQLARRARIKIGGASRAAGAAPCGWTARELEVRQLVVAGRTNSEIAAELFISPKTASVHVSSILGKLGAANGYEIARVTVMPSHDGTRAQRPGLPVTCPSAMTGHCPAALRYGYARQRRSRDHPLAGRPRAARAAGC